VLKLLRLLVLNCLPCNYGLIGLLARKKRILITPFLINVNCEAATPFVLVTPYKYALKVKVYGCLQISLKYKLIGLITLKMLPATVPPH